MKNRRTFLSLFVLASLAFVGVGYAALTNTLTIGGKTTATQNDDNLKVEFVASSAHTKDADGNEDTTFTAKHSVSGKTAEMTVGGINEVGHYAEFVYIVQNNSPELEGGKIDATLDKHFKIQVKAGDNTLSNEDDSNTFVGDHFTITAAYATAHSDFAHVGEGEATYTPIESVSGDTIVLTAGNVVFVVVTVKLTTPVFDSGSFKEHNISVTFNATSTGVTEISNG